MSNVKENYINGKLHIKQRDYVLLLNHSVIKQLQNEIKSSSYYLLTKNTFKQKKVVRMAACQTCILKQTHYETI